MTPISHRAPSRTKAFVARWRKPATLAATLTSVLVAGVLSLSRPTTTLVDLQMPSTVTDIGQWCVDHNTAAFRRTLTTNGRNQLAGCVELYGKGLTPSPTGTPTPSPTGTPTAPPTTPPATTPPTTTPPATTPPATTTPPVTTPPVTTPPVTPSPTTGFPTAATTGNPAGVTLVPHPGHIVVTTPGAVITGWDISGGVEIRANNVILRNSRIRCAGEGQCVTVGGNLTGVVIDHNDIGLSSGYGSDPQGINLWGKGAATSVLVTGNHIHNVGDGVRLNGAATLTDNLIDQLDPTSGHGDGIQAEEGPHVVIRHNTIGAGNTSSILVNDGTDENDWTIDRNLFIWGAQNNYVIHFRAASCPAKTCVFGNNVITHPFPAGSRSVVNAWPSPDLAHWFGNVFSDNTGAVPLP